MHTVKKILGLIGRKVDYSWSPLIHNTAADLLDLPFCYTIFNIGRHEEIPAALQGAKALGIAGFNVTIPYKQTVLASLDQLSPEAESVGAVNTIVLKEGRLEGYNTDIAGVARPLAVHADRISGKPAGIFGNGGAAMAAIEALSRNFSPSSIRLFVRDLHKGEQLAESLQNPRSRSLMEVFSMQDHEAIQNCRLLINATPVGTTGSGSAHLLSPESALLHNDQIIFDMVYNPLQTPLLAMAARAGATTIPGIEMLLAQAAQSFFIWTGRTMPVDTIRQNLLGQFSS